MSVSIYDVLIDTVSLNWLRSCTVGRKSQDFLAHLAFLVALMMIRLLQNLLMKRHKGNIKPVDELKDRESHLSPSVNSFYIPADTSYMSDFSDLCWMKVRLKDGFLESSSILFSIKAYSSFKFQRNTTCISGSNARAGSS